MLANLLQVPTDDASWAQFSFNLREEIDRIDDAIQAQHKVNLPRYQLDPINWDDVFSWLAYVSQSHSAFNDVLNLPSQDLLAVDLKDIRQREAWIWLQYSEIRDAQQALGI